MVMVKIRIKKMGKKETKPYEVPWGYNRNAELGLYVLRIMAKYVRSGVRDYEQALKRGISVGPDGARFL